MKRKKIYCWILFLFLMAWTPISMAWPDGGYFSSRSVAVSADQRAIIIKNGSDISMTFSTGYTGDGENFGWIIPTPVPSTVEDVSEAGEKGEEAFQVLDKYTAPEISVSERSQGCFPAGTEVLTSDGPRAIEKIKPGTEIYANDPESGEWILSKVSKQGAYHYEGDMISIQVGRITIQATGNHPFCVLRGDLLSSRPPASEVPKHDRESTAGIRWVEARDLRVGDVLKSKNAGDLMITSLSSRHEKAEVYHLEVERYHNYTIHRTGILVHNGGKKEPTAAVEEKVEPLVTVYGKVTLEHYEVSILRAADASALMNWLRENDYQVDSAAKEIIDIYIDENWAFAAVKLNPSEKRHYENEFLPPLTIKFQSDQLIFPLRISSVSTTKTAKITLYVIAESTVSSDNTPTAKLRYDDILVKGADPEEYIDACIKKTIADYAGRGLVVLWSGKFDRSAQHRNILDSLMKVSYPKDQDCYLTRLETRMDPASMTEDIELIRDMQPQWFAVHLSARRGYDLSVLSKEVELIAASQAGEMEKVAELLRAGADVNATDEYNRTAVVWAARSGHVEVVKMLLEAGADPNGTAGVVETPLVAAAGRGYTKLVELLLEAGADVNRRNWRKSTALIEAILCGDAEIVQLLLDTGARVDLKNNRERTALMEAAVRGRVKLVKMLLQAGADVNARGDDNWTALMGAAKSGSGETVRILLRAGAEVNTTSHESETALTIAAGNGHTAIVSTLLEAGADMDVRSNGCTTLTGYTTAGGGTTALMWAANKGHDDIVELLLQAGADADAKNNDGETPLIVAARRGHVRCVETLLVAGADVNATNEDGETALLQAAMKGSFEIVQMILEAGAEVEAGNRSGLTPLMFAARNGNSNTVRILLEAGADVYAKDKSGKTALSHARYNRHMHVVELIRKAEAEKLQAVQWLVDEGGFRRFYTNDAGQLGEWFVHVIDDSLRSPMTVVETTVNRISGHEGASFGIVFCFQDLDNFYKLRISIKGRYKISKYVGGAQTTLVDWTSSESLNKGYGVINKIKVVYLGNNSFEYYLNDTREGVFTDQSFSWGYSGYYAWISENDVLPGEPVDLGYMQLQPTQDP